MTEAWGFSGPHSLLGTLVSSGGGRESRRILHSWVMTWQAVQTAGTRAPEGPSHVAERAAFERVLFPDHPGEASTTTARGEWPEALEVQGKLNHETGSKDAR